MDPNTLRTNVWEQMLMADTRANYFAELTRHYLVVDKWLRVAMLVASSGTFLALIRDWTLPVRALPPALATAISFWLLVSQYSTMSRYASDLHAGWSAAHRDYERLWDSLDHPAAEATYHQIYDRAEGFIQKWREISG